MKLISVPSHLIEDLYESFKRLNNQERLLVVMYFLSDLPDDQLTLQVIENNLIKVYPPSLKDKFLPKDYKDFQASVIRGQFNNQEQRRNTYWINTGPGCWKNNVEANDKALEIIKKTGVVNFLGYSAIDSWRKFSNKLLFKSVDLSCLKYNKSIIPYDYKSFFLDVNLNIVNKEIKLIYHSDEYKGKVSKTTRSKTKNEYSISWEPAFTKVIEKNIGSLSKKILDKKSIKDLPEVRFEKLDDGLYAVEIINLFTLEKDAISDFESEYKEGKRVDYYGSKYERNASLRKRAIEYHGTKCRVCGFDFYDIYGERGEGFIEIHHKKPLYKIDGEVSIDPKYDLIPLCSNCHRMIHRIKDDYLSVEDLDRIVKENK